MSSDDTQQMAAQAEEAQADEAQADEANGAVDAGAAAEVDELAGEEADPALDELKSFLSEAGVELRGLEELEQSLQTEEGEDGGAGEEQRIRAATPRRAASNARRTSQQQAFEGLDEGLKSEAVDVVISEDRLTATISRLDASTTRQQIIEALKAHKVRFGLQQEALVQALARAEAGEEVTDLVVARGTPPQPGREGHFDWVAKVGGRAGTILEDGSIDLRDRRLITVVQAEQVVGRLVPARPGEPGKDVLGQQLKPAAVLDLEVTTDSRLDAGEPDADGVVEYTANAEGGIYHVDESREVRGALHRRLKIGITASTDIEGDVDYGTGHVEFNGDVNIGGSVKALFEVKASGSVTVGGNVEPGAKVKAGRDILVAGAVVGVETQLEAGGNVMAKFVQKSTVRAGGDVEVGAYIFEASVRARGGITVTGAGEGSGRALVGGLVWAGKGIETPSLGSPSNPRIRVVAGVDPQLVDRSERIRGKLKLLDERQQKLLDAIGVDEFDTRAIKQKIKSASAERRTVLVKAVKKLTEQAEATAQLRRQLAEVAEAQRALAAKARIAVTGTVFAGPQLRIGEQALRLTEDAGAGEYAVVEDEGKRRIELVHG